MATLPTREVAAESEPGSVVDLDAREELLENARIVKQAMRQVAVSEPLKVAALSKRHSELIAEIRALDGVPASAVPADGGKENPFRAFFGDGNVAGLPTAASRKSS